MLLSRDVLTSISKTTEGGAVTVTVAAGKAENAGGLLKGQKDVTEEALKDCSVTEVTIRSGKEKVTAFGGKSITSICRWRTRRLRGQELCRLSDQRRRFCGTIGGQVCQDWWKALS
ncbi:MAG: hypothetical protein ACLT5P_02990 [Flavonifractor plautii]